MLPPIIIIANQPKRFIPVSEAAKRLSQSRSWVYERIHLGQIRAYQMGGKGVVLIDEQELEEDLKRYPVWPHKKGPEPRPKPGTITKLK